MKVELKNGTITEFNVEDINRVYFENATAPDNPANGKRLESIAYDDEVCYISYDDQGRMSTISTPEENYVITYGSGNISFNDNLYTLQDSKIISEQGSEINANFIYEDDKLVSYTDTDDGWTRVITMGWSGGNNVTFKKTSNGTVTHDATIEYYDDEAHPAVHGFFNRAAFVYGWPSISDFVLKQGGYFLYPYYGATAKNLVKRITCTEYDDRDTYVYIYNFEYIRNAENDVVKVLVTNDEGSLTTYTLEWDK